MSRLVAIVGPTATGKSDLAEAVALELSADIISVDAMQVYRGMDIGTAKVPQAERKASLLMVDIADPSEAYSVQMFQLQARKLVDERIERGCNIVFCGGTGLYLNAVIDEMDFPKGEKLSPVRDHYESLAEELGNQGIWELLKERDPQSAELIHPNNTRRVVRALEMLDEGIHYAEQTSGLHEHKQHYPCKIFGLTMDRERLYERIDLRVDAMFEAGLVDEVKSLVNAGFESSHTATQAIGYKEVLEYLNGTVSLEEAIDTVKLRTRHYAKRQLSWFRRDERVIWINLDTHSLDEAKSFILKESE